MMESRKKVWKQPGIKKKSDNAEETDKEETVTEIFDLDDTKPDEDNLDDDEDVVTVEKIG